MASNVIAMATTASEKDGYHRIGKESQPVDRTRFELRLARGH